MIRPGSLPRCVCENGCRVTLLILALAGTADFNPPAVALPDKLKTYDPSGQVRFSTPQQADARRQELVRFIWPEGLPVNALPRVTAGVDRGVFERDLMGLNSALARMVQRLDAEVAPYDFHSTLYLIYPKTGGPNNRRLVILNSGHRKGPAFTYGVDETANRLLSEGFNVLMTDMPLVGFNTNNTVQVPGGGGMVTVTNRGSAGHNEMFNKLTPPMLPGGTVFRFFLEPTVQGVNYFLQATPDALDVAFVGLSGGGWTAHMVASIDPRIRQSFAVAGAYPLYVRAVVPVPDDAEQRYTPLYQEIDTNGDGVLDAAAGVASWLEIFALGGYGPDRRQVQVLNLHDSCCFFGDMFTTYTNFVAGIVRQLGQGEWAFYSDTSHSNHVISSAVLDSVIMPALTGPEVALTRPTVIAPIQAPFDMPQPQRPAFPSKTFNILDYGAKDDGTTKSTEAFGRAIAACNAAGGGMVRVPAGRWLTGAIHLKGNVNLHMEEGAEIHFSDDPQDYLPVVFTRWAGFEVMNYSPLIYANDCTNIAVTGPGRLFGHGRKWWEWNKRLDERDKIGPLLQEHAIKATPPEQRVFGNPEAGLRPQFISPINCRNVLLEGFTIAQPGPFWTIQFIYCTNVIARGLTLHTTGGPNTDGINLDSTRNALVEHCLLDVGDDAVALKSGINEDGRRVGRPTENVIVRNITVLTTHGGIVIGSDMSGGVRNVLAHDCVFDGAQIGIRLKSNPARGGTVENIHYRNITMRRIRYEAIRLESNYAAWGAATNQTNYPTFRNITIKDLVCDGAGRAAEIQGTPQRPIESLALESVSIRANAGMKCDWVTGLKLVKVVSTPASGEPISLQNCKDVVQK
jgi:hypothetical protein